MDLTPRLLTEVEFREQWRGYSPNDVDDFLERVAASVGELQERLREATERATQAERRLLERSDDDEIRRTLVLAQRTAVSAVEEARAEAERILEDAHARAREQVADAEARLAALESDIAERTRIELGELADRRAALQADVDALAAFQEEHRARLRAELQRQLDELDAPPGDDAPLAVPDPPRVSDVDASVPEPAFDIDIEPAPPPEVVDGGGVSRAPTEEEVAQAREDLLEALRRAGVDDLLAGVQPEAEAPMAAEPDPDVRGHDPEPALDIEGVDEPVAMSEPDPDPAPELDAPAPRLYDAAADESGEHPITPAAEPAQAGEPTAAYELPVADDDVDALQWRQVDDDADHDADADHEADDDDADDDIVIAPAPVPAAEDDDDPFLAELRRAVTDTEPLGPRDEDEVMQQTTRPEDAVPSGRFRLRRGR